MKPVPTAGFPRPQERYELIGRISSGLAHELNGPIGIALGFNELATELLDSAGEVALTPQTLARLREYLGLTASASVRARTLARRISQLSKLETGAVTTFDLAEAVDEAAAVTGPAVKSGQIEISRRASAGGPANVTADKALCIFAFARLFLLAPDALPGGGTVAWDITSSPTGPAGQVRFLLSAEPWGTVKSAAWPVPADLASAFASQGGALGPSVSRRASVTGGLAPASPIWELPGFLPAAAAAGSGAADTNTTSPVAAARPARSGRRAAAR
jgi:hypothetical protein